MNKLSGNKLKIIALFSMTVDHIGKIFFPSVILFEIIGRLAFPIFAYLIAEGWQYTSNKKKYFSIIWIMGILYQIVYYVFCSSLYIGVFITYGLSLLVICFIEYLLSKKKFCWILSPLVIAFIIFICLIEYIFPYRDFAIDYGIVGVMIPVIIYFNKTKKEKLCFLFIALCGLVFIYDIIQIFTLLSVVLLFMYNGERGNKKLKYLFYIYYPGHLVILWLLSFFM